MTDLRQLVLDSAPIKPDKGKFGGSCNRRACQRSPAVWYNRGSFAYYCEDCAHVLNRAHPIRTDDRLFGLKAGDMLCIEVSEPVQSNWKL